MLYFPNITAIRKWSETNENKRRLVLTYIQSYSQTKYKLIHRKLE